MSDNQILLGEASHHLKRRAASEVDGVDWAGYGEDKVYIVCYANVLGFQYRWAFKMLTKYIKNLKIIEQSFK
ncbi:MAG: hypothetical protein P8179_23080 [Candidatus Thiodiazotropha sp.]|jgi:hypothetical protein